MNELQENEKKGVMRKNKEKEKGPTSTAPLQPRCSLITISGGRETTPSVSSASALLYYPTSTMNIIITSSHHKSKLN